MPRMLSLWADKLARVGSGLGLLLLLAAQENVCPWLIAQPATPPATPVSENPNEQPKRPKPSLPLVLRDAPPRPKLAGWAHATMRQACGDRDGVVSCGSRNPQQDESGPQGVAANPLAWHALQSPVEPNGVSVCAGGCRPKNELALRSCITPTGPPCA
jgi:hypothetical protein